MTLKEIREAVNEGGLVYYVNQMHRVVRVNHEYYIEFNYKLEVRILVLLISNEGALNGNEKDFFKENSRKDLIFWGASDKLIGVT